MRRHLRAPILVFFPLVVSVPILEQPVYAGPALTPLLSAGKLADGGLSSSSNPALGSPGPAEIATIGKWEGKEFKAHRRSGP